MHDIAKVRVLFVAFAVVGERPSFEVSVYEWIIGVNYLASRKHTSTAVRRHLNTRCKGLADWPTALTPPTRRRKTSPDWLRSGVAEVFRLYKSMLTNFFLSYAGSELLARPPAALYRETRG